MLDEGMKVAGLLSQWNETKTFCLYENATFHIRLDPLNSAFQPYPIRQFAQSHEAYAIYNFTVGALKSMEAYAWPFRSFFRTWSDVRVVIEGANLKDLVFHYERAPGPLCGGLQSMGQSLWSLHSFLPTLLVAPLQISLQTLSHVCEWYAQESLMECLPLSNTGSCYMILNNPPASPCVSISSPSPSLYSTTPATYTFQLAFYSVMSSNYFLYTLLGLILFYSASSLARSRTFHYILGACAGITFSIAIALYIMRRQSKAMSRMIPGVQLIQTIGTLFSLIVPFTGFVLVPSLYSLLSKCWSLIYSIWTTETFLGIPHVGKLYFLVFGVFGCLLVWWNQWGATPVDPHAKPQDDAEIEEIGWLEDEEYPLTISQTLLARGLQIMGLIFLYHGTCSSTSSLVLVMMVIFTDVFESIATILYYWYHYESPGRHSTKPLISRQEYHEQGKTETEKALANLQMYLQSHPEALEVVKEENEIRLRRFAKGRDHLDVATRDSMTLQTRKNKRTSWLWIW